VNEERSRQARAAARARRRLRILIADDERDQVATLAAILNDEGHDVREVYRGTEVLRMTGMTGYDVAREVREHYDKTRPLLIAVTGWKKPSDRILARLAGFDHHLAKPFESQQLLELLEPLAGGSPSGK
jgi:CheY-like chemotaxis protein